MGLAQITWSKNLHTRFMYNLYIHEYSVYVLRDGQTGIEPLIRLPHYTQCVFFFFGFLSSFFFSYTQYLSRVLDPFRQFGFQQKVPSVHTVLLTQYSIVRIEAMFQCWLNGSRWTSLILHWWFLHAWDAFSSKNSLENCWNLAWFFALNELNWNWMISCKDLI